MDLKRLGNGEVSFEYTLVKRRGARSIRVAVAPGGKVKVSAPRFVPLFLIEKFLKEKSVWIEEQLQKSPELYPAKLNKKELAALRKEMLERTTARVEFYAKKFEFEYKKISVKNMSSRWGSCSVRGNLNFNIKMHTLPPDLFDYIVVHELCHLKQMNHGKLFWKEVQSILPSYEEARKKLRKVRL